MSPALLTGAGASEFAVLCVYALAVGAASVAGGALPGRVRLTHLRLQLAMSCVGGLMLGVALFGLIPHAAAGFGRIEPALWGVAAGLLGMFFLLRFAPFHSHEPPSVVEHEGGEEGCGHPHHDPHPSAARWAGAAFGLGVHALIDGAALAAAVRGGHSGGGALGLGALPGLGAFLAIALHKPLDAVTVMTLARTAPGGSWSRRNPGTINLLFAAIGPAGAIGFYLLAGAAPAEHLVVGTAMALAAGAFLCIALSDLLPELEFHSHDRLKLSAALLLGVAVAAGVEVFAHGYAHRVAAEGEEAGPLHTHPHGHPHSH
ncbi:ZIP family metal transporter [Alienimonas sp. DA493]|uniref:ZIP family metal transporter n=1 Tax=Alienimonas sp. DA493 TaxID=3373605 RepID=UPI0037552120